MPATQLYRSIYEKIIGGAAGLQWGNGAALTLTDRRRSRADAQAQHALQSAQSRINALEAQLQEMNELIRADQLTGALNRRGLDEAFEREFARSARSGQALCAALLDLDNFKRINDEFGHAAGDAVLVHFAKIVGDSLRSMDVLARFGGEEFVILLPATSPADAMMIMGRIQRELAEQTCRYQGHALPVTFSAGAAVYHAGEAQQDLLNRADAALYKAKHAGKNQTIFAAVSPHLVAEQLAA